RVVVVDPAVDVGDDDALAGHTVVTPHVVGVDIRHAPLDCLGDHAGRLRLHRVRAQVGAWSPDLFDRVELGQFLRQRPVTVTHQDRVGDPVRLVLHAVVVQGFARSGLGTLRGGLELVDDHLAAGRPVVDGDRSTGVGVGVETDPK